FRPRTGGSAVVVARSGADVADVPHVVVQPLELERNGANRSRPAWRLDTGDLLDGLAKPQAMRDRTNAADPLNDVERVQGAQPLDALLQPAVCVEESRVQVQHRLADRAEAEVAGLDDARVNRSHRHFEHSLSLDEQVRKLHRWLHGGTLAGIERLAQR